MKRIITMTTLAALSTLVFTGCSDDKKDDAGVPKISKVSMGLSQSTPIYEVNYVWDGSRITRIESKENSQGVMTLTSKSEISYVGGSNSQIDEIIAYSIPIDFEKKQYKSNWIKRPSLAMTENYKSGELKPVQKIKFHYSNGIVTRLDRYLPDEMNQMVQVSYADIEYVAGKASKLVEKMFGTNEPMEEAYFVWQNGNIVSLYSKMPAGMNGEWITVDSTYNTFDDKNSAYLSLNEFPIFEIEAGSKNNILTSKQYMLMDMKNFTEVLSLTSSFVYRSDNFPETSTNAISMIMFPFPMTLYGKFEYR